MNKKEKKNREIPPQKATQECQEKQNQGKEKSGQRGLAGDKKERHGREMKGEENETLVDDKDACCVA